VQFEVFEASLLLFCDGISPLFWYAVHELAVPTLTAPSTKRKAAIFANRQKTRIFVLLVIRVGELKTLGFLVPF
jgi:hypothetical protein